MLIFSGASDKSCSRVLKEMEMREKRHRKTVMHTVTIVEARGDESRTLNVHNSSDLKTS